MNEFKNDPTQEMDLKNFMNQQYDSSENKEDLDYWTAYSRVILESLHLRDKYEYSQSRLADILKTTQSVISRFENMGRLPSYDFLSRLALAFNDSLGITLTGNFMAVVPLEKQDLIKRLASQNQKQTQDYVQDLLNEIISQKEKERIKGKVGNTNLIEVDFKTQKRIRSTVNSASDDDPFLLETVPSIDQDYNQA
jgi:transcriptional regulator with XRE-family HTH domain